MEGSLGEALSAIFTGGPYLPASAGRAEEVAYGLGVRAWNHYRKALEHQRNGNWKDYGEELKKLENILQKLKDK